MKPAGELTYDIAMNQAHYKKAEQSSDFLGRFTRWSWIIIVAASICQAAFWPSWENLFAVATILFCWKLVSTFILSKGVLFRYPFSSFLILGFFLTQYGFPLVFTLLETRPVIFNMNVPFEVFLHLLLSMVVVLSSHGLYRHWQKRNRSFSNRWQVILVRVGVFTEPSKVQISLMGVIGLLAMFYVYFYSPSVGDEVSGSGDKFIQGLIPFTYAPFFVFISRMYGRNRKLSRSGGIWLAFFVVLLFIVSIGRNSRGAFMFGFTSLAIGYFLGLLNGFFQEKIITKKNFILTAIGLWLVTGPLSDLATAMVLVRSERGNVSRSELVSLTFEMLENKKAIEEKKKSSTYQSSTGWDEHYLDNVFLARFCNLKFNDASLEMAEKIGKVDPVVTEYAIEKPMAILPKPIIATFGLNINKDRVNSGSSGDVLFERSGGSNAIGVFRVGHFSGFGMASFGWWYLAFLFVLTIPLYFLWDLLSLRVRGRQGKARLVLSLTGLLSMTALFQYFSFDNVLIIIQFLVRGWIQMIILYLVLFHLTKILSNSIAKK